MNWSTQEPRPGLRAVCLRDVPFTDRMRAARVAARREVSNVERLAIFAAAVAPSDRVYYVRDRRAA